MEKRPSMCVCLKLHTFLHGVGSPLHMRHGRPRRAQLRFWVGSSASPSRYSRLLSMLQEATCIQVHHTSHVSSPIRSLLVCCAPWWQRRDLRLYHVHVWNKRLLFPSARVTTWCNTTSAWIFHMNALDTLISGFMIKMLFSFFSSLLCLFCLAVFIVPCSVFYGYVRIVCCIIKIGATLLYCSVLFFFCMSDMFHLRTNIPWHCDIVHFIRGRYSTFQPFEKWKLTMSFSSSGTHFNILIRFMFQHKHQHK